MQESQLFLYSSYDFDEDRLLPKCQPHYPSQNNYLQPPPSGWVYAQLPIHSHKPSYFQIKDYLELSFAMNPAINLKTPRSATNPNCSYS